MRVSKHLMIAAVALLATAGTARAADVTADQAGRLEQAINTWLADALGPGIKLPVRPVRLEAAAPLREAPRPTPPVAKR